MVARVCVVDLAAELAATGIDVKVNDWEDYGPYDIAVLRGSDRATAAEIAKAKARNPRIRVAVADPKLSHADYIEAARSADLLMVSSIEQREAFLRLNRNVLIHYMFPRLPRLERTHSDTSPVVIGYHGNKVHIETMAGSVDRALEAVARRHLVSFDVVYNVASLGEAHRGLPDPTLVHTRHIQWTWDVYGRELAQADIGLVPNLLPIQGRQAALDATAVPGLNANYEPFDFLARFKASCNPGRIYPFVMAGIPVIADFVPSAAQFIRHGESGFLVATPHGWYEAIEALASDPQLRTRMAAAARLPFERECERRAGAFLDAMESLRAGGPIEMPDGDSLDEQLKIYCPPPQPSLARTFLNRLIGR